MVNPDAISRLVVFDTWTLNCDRHPADLSQRRPNRDNVFLQDATDRESSKSRLIAMDHTHCFTCGRDLTGRIADIDRVKDDRVYGLFPAFKRRMRLESLQAAVDQLQLVDEEEVRESVESIPVAWQVTARARAALIELICRRAAFVADTVMDAVRRKCWPDQLFDCE